MASKRVEAKRESLKLEEKITKETAEQERIKEKIAQFQN